MVISLEQFLELVPTYVLVAFRVGGLMLLAPLFGSTRVPRRVKGMFVVVTALGMLASVERPVTLPASTWELSAAIAGELLFGLAMGMSLAFVFTAAQWAGEMIGQQIGFNISEVLDPQFGAGGSLVGDLFFMLTIVVFLTVGGHHALLLGVHESLRAAPPLALAMSDSLLDGVVELLAASTVLAFRLAAPMFVTMLVVDVATGAISKTMPQLNVLTAGLAIRALVGLIVVMAGAYLLTGVLQDSLLDAMDVVRGWYGRPMR